MNAHDTWPFFPNPHIYLRMQRFILLHPLIHVTIPSSTLLSRLNVQVKGYPRNGLFFWPCSCRAPNMITRLLEALRQVTGTNLSARLLGLA